MTLWFCFRLAEHLELPIRCDVPVEFLQLLQLYPQPVRRQPSVEYTPAPRGGRKSGDQVPPKAWGEP